MKKIKWSRIIMTLAVILMLTGAAACGSQESEEADETASAETVSVETDGAESLAETEIALTESETDMETEAAETESYDRESSLAAYRQALEDFYNTQTFPDGTVVSTMSSDMSGNEFVIYDVDKDGRDELVILFISGSMAEMVAHIYDYDEASDSLYLELSQFPSLTFYDNGMIAAGISHNQGYAGDFWPYSLYRHDEESDTYVLEAFADAWDRSLSETNYDGSSFPEEADADGDGIVYYVLDSYNGDYDEPMDRDAYEAWYEATVGAEIEISFAELTEENIAGVGVVQE